MSHKCLTCKHFEMNLEFDELYNCQPGMGCGKHEWYFAYPDTKEDLAHCLAKGEQCTKWENDKRDKP